MTDKEKVEIPSLDLSGCQNIMYSLETQPLTHFPKQFPPYPHQVSALGVSKDFFADPTERIMLLYISTAGGKSPLGVSFTKSWIDAGGASVIICPNKELQSQYEMDFGKEEISVVKGAGSFTCASNPNLSCGSIAARKACSFRKLGDESIPLGQKPCACPYQGSRSKAAIDAKAKPMCFTPHSYLAYKKNPRFSKYLPDGNGLMVVDEAQMLPDILADMLTLSIRIDMIEDLLGHSGIDGDSFDQMFLGPVKGRNVNHEGLPMVKFGGYQTAYLDGLVEAIKIREAEVERCIKERDDESLTDILPMLAFTADDEKYNKYLDLLASIRESVELIVLTAKETDWACEITKNSQGSMDQIIPQSKRGGELRILIRPGIIPMTFLKNFFRGYSKVMLMSGTLFKDHLKRLGLVTEENITEEGKIIGACSFEAESRIPADRRKIYIDTAHGVSVNFKNIDESFQKFAKFIVDELVPKFPGEKGMIHVSSSAQAEKLQRFCNLEALKRFKRLSGLKGAKTPLGPMSKFVTAEAQGWDKTFKAFKAAKVGGKHGECLFLIAARRYEGIDLKDSLCRMNIIAKAPYPNSKDTIVCSLDEIFKTYSVVTTITSFIQAANRAVRHPKDWALNICLDTSMKGIFDRFISDMPSYVQDAIEVAHDPKWLDKWKIPDDKVKKGLFG